MVNRESFQHQQSECTSRGTDLDRVARFDNLLWPKRYAAMGERRGGGKANKYRVIILSQGNK